MVMLAWAHVRHGLDSRVSTHECNGKMYVGVEMYTGAGTAGRAQTDPKS